MIFHRSGVKRCIVKKVNIKDVLAVQDDADVDAFLCRERAGLGKRGNVVLKLSGIPTENSILVERKSKKRCAQVMEELEKLLIGKGYMDCPHDWEVLKQTDYGEMDYCSYGGGVEHYVVTVYRCRLCGAQHKESRGECCGDPPDEAL